MGGGSLPKSNCLLLVTHPHLQNVSLKFIDNSELSCSQDNLRQNYLLGRGNNITTLIMIIIINTEIAMFQTSEPAEEKQCQRVTESDIHRQLRHLVKTPCVPTPTLSMWPLTAVDAARLLMLPPLLLTVDKTKGIVRNVIVFITNAIDHIIKISSSSLSLCHYHRITSMPYTDTHIHIGCCQSSTTSIFQPPPSRRTTTSSQHARPSGVLRCRFDGLERAAWRPPRPVAQCRQFISGRG